MDVPRAWRRGAGLGGKASSYEMPACLLPRRAPWPFLLLGLCSSALSPKPCKAGTDKGPLKSEGRAWSLRRKIVLISGHVGKICVGYLCTGFQAHIIGPGKGVPGFWSSKDPPVPPPPAYLWPHLGQPLDGRGWEMNPSSQHAGCSCHG